MKWTQIRTQFTRRQPLCDALVWVVGPLQDLFSWSESDYNRQRVSKTEETELKCVFFTHAVLRERRVLCNGDIGFVAWLDPPPHHPPGFGILSWGDPPWFWSKKIFGLEGPPPFPFWTLKIFCLEGPPILAGKFAGRCRSEAKKKFVRGFGLRRFSAGGTPSHPGDEWIHHHLYLYIRGAHISTVTRRVSSPPGDLVFTVTWLTLPFSPGLSYSGHRISSEQPIQRYFSCACQKMTTGNAKHRWPGAIDQGRLCVNCGSEARLSRTRRTGNVGRLFFEFWGGLLDRRLRETVLKCFQVRVSTVLVPAEGFELDRMGCDGVRAGGVAACGALLSLLQRDVMDTAVTQHILVCRKCPFFARIQTYKVSRVDLFLLESVEPWTTCSSRHSSTRVVELKQNFFVK